MGTKQADERRKAIAGKTKAELYDAMAARVEEMDLRRQAQINNQRDSINRVMRGASYDDEMAKLHELLAEAQTQLELARQELKKLRGETVPAYDLGSL